MVIVNVCTGLLGLYALSLSPVISYDSKFPFPIKEDMIKKIDGIELDNTFFYRLPLFFSPKEELQWWQLQGRVYNALRGKNSAMVEFVDRDGIIRNIQAPVNNNMPVAEVIKMTWPIYLAALIHIISAVSVFKRQHSSPGIVLAFFLLFCGLYLISSAPIVNRSITLVPLHFKILTMANYIATGGLITLVHFSLIFPEPKELIKKSPFISYAVIYGYLFLVTVLYLTELTAFASSDPFLFLWISVIIGAFVHSIIKEKDMFLKKQISLSLLAPLLVAVIFTIFNFLPGLLGTTSMKFTYFALFSLILPYALPSALDNSRLYLEKLEIERNSQKEKERIRQDLHDDVLNDLANISVSSELTLAFLEKDIDGAKERLNMIRDTARDSSRQLRGLLWITDESCKTWIDFSSHLRRYGISLVKFLDIDFEMEVNGHVATLGSPSPTIRACLFRVFREAMTNIIKHSRADAIRARLSGDDAGIIFEIKDNGKGFDAEAVEEGHYGLGNMQKRMEEIGGSLAIESGHLQGSKISFRIPLD